MKPTMLRYKQKNKKLENKITNLQLKAKTKNKIKTKKIKLKSRTTY